jgi:hypothetical protein
LKTKFIQKNAKTEPKFRLKPNAHPEVDRLPSLASSHYGVIQYRISKPAAVKCARRSVRPSPEYPFTSPHVRTSTLRVILALWLENSSITECSTDLNISQNSFLSFCHSFMSLNYRTQLYANTFCISLFIYIQALLFKKLL